MGKLLVLVGTGVVATVIAGCAPPPAGDLGIGGDYSEATSVNASGYIAGLRQEGQAQTVFVREPDGDVVDPFPGKHAYRYVFLTGAGTVVAFTFPPDCPPMYCGETSRRTPDGRVATMTGGPIDVNERGDVLGGLSVWRADGSIVELPTSPDFAMTDARAINDAGDVFGVVAMEGEVGARLVRWDADDQELHVLVELPLGQAMWVEDVNAAGEVVGTVSVPDSDGTFTATPVLWRTARTPVERVDLPGRAGPVAINARGAIVGVEETDAGGSRAVYWTPGSHELRPLRGGDQVAQVRDISDRGEVVGVGTTSDGRWVAMRFTL